jgi:hypothetical protein
MDDETQRKLQDN